MKKVGYLTAAMVIVFFLGACYAQAEPGAEGIGDPYFPMLGNGGYDVDRYEIDLDVDMEAKTIESIVTIQAQTTEALSRFNLDFSPYQINSVEIDGRPANFEQIERELIIYPSRPLRKGMPFTTVVSYQGSPDDFAKVNTAYGGKEGWVFYDDGAYVVGEPVGSSRWFPVNEHPQDKATYQFRISVPKPFEVAASGSLLEVIEFDHRREYIWESQDPLASYLVGLGIGEYETEVAKTSSGVPVRNFYDKGISESLQNRFDRQPEMIDFFETVFGPYPFEAYGALVIDRHEYFALENQTLSIFVQPFVNEEVISHELAHQWFGDSVTPELWQEIWLNEGFATYASVLWLEHTQGVEAANTTLKSYYQEMVRGENRFNPPGDPGPNQLFHPQVYLRGALTLHALREQVGDEAFFNLIRTYYESYRDENVRTEDFIDIAERIGGLDLSTFFDDWLYQVEIPDIPTMDLYRRDYLDD